MTTSESTPNIDPSLSPDGPVHVAAAVIRRDGRVLLSRRPVAAHQGGKWEFPGGKLEAGESAAEALGRELDEELGIRPTRYRPLITVPHDYPDKSVVLHVFLVEAFSGTPAGREGQAIRWVDREDLNALPFPDANYPILKAVDLPPVCAITPPRFEDPDRFLDRLRLNLRLHEMMILRLPGLGVEDYLRVARQASRLATACECRLLLTCAADQARALGAAGAHLNSRALRALERPVDDDSAFLVSAACHDADELARAEWAGVDFALLSPVARTATHPEAEPMGWRRFSELTRSVKIPVYALGGMDPAQCSEAFAHGAQGVAGIRGFWRS